jgi:hypothetical protein
LHLPIDDESHAVSTRVTVVVRDREQRMVILGIQIELADYLDVVVAESLLSETRSPKSSSASSLSR